jgi:hypothetical protein
MLRMVTKRSTRRVEAPITTWTTDPDDQLYTIADLDRTPLGRMSRRTRYRLVSNGQLATITINGRHYITKAAVLNLLKLQ